MCAGCPIRLPKAVLYSELKVGKRSHGGQKLRCKDTLTRNLKRAGIGRRQRWTGKGGEANLRRQPRASSKCDSSNIRERKDRRHTTIAASTH